MSRHACENDYPDESADAWRYERDMQQALEEDQRYLDAMEEPQLGRFIHRESARRAALFAKATLVLATAAAVAGSPRPLIAVQAWYRNNGQRRGLFIELPGDREMTWTPRDGFKVGDVVYGKIPF